MHGVAMTVPFMGKFHSCSAARGCSLLFWSHIPSILLVRSVDGKKTVTIENFSYVSENWA